MKLSLFAFTLLSLASSKVVVQYVIEYTTITSSSGTVSTLITPGDIPSVATLEDSEVSFPAAPIRKNVASQVASAEASATSSSSSSGGEFTGDGTYYEPEMGSCGWVNSEDEYVVAISNTRYTEIMKAHGLENPNKNPVCGKYIKAWSAEDPSRSTTVKVVDRCMGCEEDDIDLSHAGFDDLYDRAVGRAKVKWSFVDFDG